MNADARLPASDAVQLNREHRLYQADWLLRFYKFDVTEIIDEKHPFLDPDLDPKANWALNHLDFFPVEVNAAPFEDLVRVPGIGVRGAKLIVKARRTASLGEPELRKLGIAYKRARFFITCRGRWAGKGADFSIDIRIAQLASPIEGGRHGRRADRVSPNQLSLFDAVETSEKTRIGRVDPPDRGLPEAPRAEGRTPSGALLQDAGRAGTPPRGEAFPQGAAGPAGALPQVPEAPWPLERKSA